MLHVLPIGDTKEHIEESTCECNPTVIPKNGEMICVHNAFDNREFIEQLCDDINNSHPPEGVNKDHWAIQCLLRIKALIEKYNKELPKETSGCSNHVYNEIQSALITNKVN